MRITRRSMSVLGLGALMLGSLAAGVAPVTAQDATPAMEECAATTPEENKALVNEFFAAVDGGDVSALVAEDLVYHDPSGEGPGDDEAQEWADERQEDDRVVHDANQPFIVLMSSTAIEPRRTTRSRSAPAPRATPLHPHPEYVRLMASTIRFRAGVAPEGNGTIEGRTATIRRCHRHPRR